MKSKNEMLDRGLASIDPGRAEDWQSEASNADALLAEILASDPNEGASPGRPHLRSSRKRAFAVVAVGAVALIAAIVDLPNGGGGERGTLPVLARVAEAAAKQPAQDTSLPYFYTKTRGTYVDTSVYDREHQWSTYDTVVVERWVAKDGSGRQLTTTSAPQFVSAKDRAAWESAGRPNFLSHGFAAHTESESFPPGHFSDRPYNWTQIAQAPTDPPELARWLQDKVTDSSAGTGDGNGFSVAVRTLTMVDELLGNPFATPQLRAALYEAEGRVPGIDYLGRASDEIGREGIAIGAESANSGQPTVYSLIVDPDTSQVLASRQDPLDPKARASETDFIASGTTGSLTATP
jgi:hypothetical protein